MYIIEIDDKEYKFPEMHELTFGRFRQIYTWAEESQPPVFKEIAEGKDVELTDEDSLEIFRFQKNYVAYCLGLSAEEANALPMEGDSSITMLFNLLAYVLTKPEDVEPLDSFELDGVEYKCREDKVNAIGNAEPMKGARYEEFEDIVTIQASFNKVKNGMVLGLPMLIACLYREDVGTYEEERIKANAKKFEALTMDKVWGGFFFVIEYADTISKSIKAFSGEVLHQASQIMDGMPSKKELQKQGSSPSGDTTQSDQ